MQHKYIICLQIVQNNIQNDLNLKKFLTCDSKNLLRKHEEKEKHRQLDTLVECRSRAALGAIANDLGYTSKSHAINIFILNRREYFALVAEDYA